MEVLNHIQLTYGNCMLQKFETNLQILFNSIISPSYVKVHAYIFSNYSLYTGIHFRCHLKFFLNICQDSCVSVQMNLLYMPHRCRADNHYIQKRITWRTLLCTQWTQTKGGFTVNYSSTTHTHTDTQARHTFHLYIHAYMSVDAHIQTRAEIFPSPFFLFCYYCHPALGT